MTGFRSGLLLVFVALLPAAAYSQDNSENERKFEWGGDLFTQGFFLNRDLPISRPEDLSRAEDQNYEPVCPPPNPRPQGINNSTASRCREERDYMLIRLRVDFAIRPSPIADIIYGLEVGNLIYGQERGDSGPGSGGKGSGRTNLETRQLVLRLHSKDNSALLDTGIMSFYTPNGMVLAGSGAGLRSRFDFKKIKSQFEAHAIRSEDNSTLDADDNGFADTNFNDVTLGILRWDFNAFPKVDSVLYGVYRGDENESGALDGFETSRIYWSGLYMRSQIGSFSFLVHAIGNWGRFERPDRLEHIGEPARFFVENQLDELGYIKDTEGRYFAQVSEEFSLYEEVPRKEYKVNAGAGQIELGYNFTNNFEFVLQAAGASGRLGVEPDNRPSFVRSDQYRSSISAVQLSRVALDSSGGYTLFRGGHLTGLVEKGGLLKYRFENGLRVRLGYYHIEFYRTPTMDYNRFHTRYPFYLSWKLSGQDLSLERDEKVLFYKHPGIRGDSNLVGEEINLSFTYRILGGLTLEGEAGYFKAGDGYRALRDVGYGSYIGEVALSLKQLF